jgi:hypothetical protein
MAVLLFQVDGTGTYRRGHRDSSLLAGGSSRVSPELGAVVLTPGTGVQRPQPHRANSPRGNISVIRARRRWISAQPAYAEGHSPGKTIVAVHSRIRACDDLRL